MLNQARDDDLVMSLVELALARHPGDRETYVREACAGDSELFDQVWGYVKSEEQMRGFLLEPLCLDDPTVTMPGQTPQHPFEQGDILNGRFRIVRERGQGGMGIVYEAIDEKLDRRIAVKCAKAGFGKRLPPEVRHAREISHSNVCKIFEIHTAFTQYGEIDFITMELLEGETLAERLRRRETDKAALTDKEARKIARQLCSGLAEAHRNKVIHGDLKSNNVILTIGADGGTRAVITDFGLARQPEISERTVQSGSLGGTPDYMAPELWKGQKASVQSDVYALGVILYELAAGRRPHGEEVPLEERFTRKPPPVNSKWDRILMRCLDPDPKRRFRTADEVGAAFTPPRSRRWLVAAATAAALVAAASAVTYRNAIAPAESWKLAMLPIVTEDPDLAPAAEKLSSEAASQLNRLKGEKTIEKKAQLFVIPFATIRGEIKSAVEASRLSATHILSVTLTKANDQVVLHAVWLKPDGLKDWSANYAVNELRYVPVALAGFVTGTLHLVPPPQASVNAAAKQDYQTGLYYWQWNSKAGTALGFLENAVKADPDSPLTHAALAEAEWMEYNVVTHDRSWLARTSESERQAEIRNPDLAEVHRIKGLLKYNEGAHDDAAAEFLRAIEIDPNNSDAFRRLGLDREANNQPEEALQALRRARELDSNNYRNHQQLGDFYNWLGNYAEAAKHFQKAVALAPNEPDAQFALADAYMSLGKFPEAERVLRHAIDDLGPWAKALGTLAMDLMYQQNPDAVTYAQRAAKLEPNAFLWWEYLGMAYHRVNPHESKLAYERAFRVAKAELNNNSSSRYTRAHFAYLCAELGERGCSAESEISQALGKANKDANVSWEAVLTYGALQQPEKAIDILKDSSNAVIEDVARWPDLAGLCRNPRFLQLMADRGIKWEEIQCGLSTK